MKMKTDLEWGISCMLFYHVGLRLHVILGLTRVCMVWQGQSDGRKGRSLIGQ